MRSERSTRTYPAELVGPRLATVLPAGAVPLKGDPSTDKQQEQGNNR